MSAGAERAAACAREEAHFWLNGGNHVEAIRAYRAWTGCTLSAAKAAVEAMIEERFADAGEAPPCSPT